MSVEINVFEGIEPAKVARDSMASPKDLICSSIPLIFRELIFLIILVGFGSVFCLLRIVSHCFSIFSGLFLTLSSVFVSSLILSCECPPESSGLIRVGFRERGAEGRKDCLYDQA